MIYLLHGYIDVFNHELKHDNFKRIKLVTKSSDIIFAENDQYNYNSKNFVNKILNKTLLDLNNQNNVYGNSIYYKIHLKRSLLRLSPKNQTRYGRSFHEHMLKLKIHPFEDTAHIVIDDFSLIAAFKNEFNCLKQEYVLKKKYNFEENQSKLINIPQHCIQISLKDCQSYNEFKKIIGEAIYNDISSLMINEFKRLKLQKWNIDLSKLDLDVESIVNDNMEVLVS